MNPLSLLIGPISDVLKRLIPDPVERERVQGEIQKTIAENEQAMVEAMSKTMAADAASEGWLTRNARPMVVIWALLVISAILVGSLAGFADAILNALERVPGQLWNLVTVGIGGYMLARTVDKGVKAFAEQRGRP